MNRADFHTAWRVGTDRQYQTSVIPHEYCMFIFRTETRRVFELNYCTDIWIRPLTSILCFQLIQMCLLFWAAAATWSWNVTVASGKVSLHKIIIPVNYNSRWQKETCYLALLVTTQNEKKMTTWRHHRPKLMVFWTLNMTWQDEELSHRFSSWIFERIEFERGCSSW